MEGLLDQLAANHVPLIIDLCDRKSVENRDLAELLRAWPELPVILSFPKMENEARILCCLLERYHNLRVSLRGWQTLGGIEEFVRLFGAGAIVFGSNYPYFTPLQSMLHVIYSEISEVDKKRVAGDNMRELLQKAWSVHP
jgi:predicted TIM-barrel fold metal-dependent hydrolase